MFLTLSCNITIPFDAKGSENANEQYNAAIKGTISRIMV